MSTRGQLCPWHDIGLLRVQRVDYHFKNQKHDYTITLARITDIGPFTSSHLALFT